MTFQEIVEHDTILFEGYDAFFYRKLDYQRFVTDKIYRKGFIEASDNRNDSLPDN